MRTKRVLHTATKLLAAVLAVMLAAACGSSSSSSTATTSNTPTTSSSPIAGSNVSASVIAQAKAEGANIDLSWDTLDTGPEIAAWTTLFQQMYGFPAHVSLAQSPSQPENEARLAQEFKAGQKTTQDVFLGTEVTFLELLYGGILQTLNPAELPALQGKLQANDTSLPIESRITGIEYNTNEIKNPPQTMQQALTMAETGKYAIVSTPFAAGFSYLAAKQFLGPQGALAYVQKLGKYIKGTAECGSIFPRLASGEFNLYILDCGITEAIYAQQQHLPVGYVIPRDLPMIGYYYIGVPKNATHPAMAQLWMNMMATRQAQDIMYRLDLADCAIFPGSHTAALVAKLEQQDHITFTIASIAWAEQNQQAYNYQLIQQIQAAINGH